MSGADVTPSTPDGVGEEGAGRLDDERGGSDGAYESTTFTAYDVDRQLDAHHPSHRLVRPSHRSIELSDAAVAGFAVVTVVGVWSGSLGTALVLGVAAVALGTFAGSAASGAPGRGIVMLLAVALAMLGALRSDHAWTGLAPDRLGPFRGWAYLVDDPRSYPAGTRVVFEIEGERFETWSRGRAQQRRVAEWHGGEWVFVNGDRSQLKPDRAQRVASQHVVGALDLDWAGDVRLGGPVARASNRVRATIERGSSVMPDPYGALFRGLVIGDDRDQPDDMIDRFRMSGLSHLTAVSGQNVSFLLAACGPLLVRLRPRVRWTVTVALIAWFVALTRFEPSILRAGVMAMLSATAFMTGRERSPVRLLAIAVLILVLIDPLLVWSVGFWLSVGATFGVCAIGPVLTRWFERLGPLAMPLGITLGAQIGVAVPSVLVFGRLPLASVPANLLAVPVAGAVMLYGLPASLVAGLVPAVAPLVMFPSFVGTKWVDTVARIGARVEPDPPWVWIGWVVLIGVLACVVAVSARSGKNRPRHDDASADR